MSTVQAKTFVQRYVSPLATRLFRAAFLDRRAVAWGIRTVSNGLSEKENVSLKMTLGKFNITLPKYQSLDPKELEHHHLSKNITPKRISNAVKELSDDTGRKEFNLVLPEILTGRRSGELDLGREDVDYRKVLEQTVRHRILRDLEPETLDGKSEKQKILEEAFFFAADHIRTENAELIYRMRKMTDIGGDLQTIISTLFLDVPSDKLAEIFDGAATKEHGLYAVTGPVLKIIQGFQTLKESFSFSRKELDNDKDYIFKKMSELVWNADSPETLLLFFLHKLKEARHAKNAEDVIFDEIHLLYAPLAERLGLIFLADDFRDQSLRLKDQQKYEDIEAKVEERIGMGYENAKIFLNLYAKELFIRLQNKLGSGSQGIQIKFRIKSPYSIWNKVEQRKEYDYEDLKDILGIKIICESKQQLELVLNFLKKNDFFVTRSKDIKTALKPMQQPGWKGVKIAGRDGSDVPIEIQLMTQEMNQENNRGIAATWRYNLNKELDGIEQVFEKVEPKEVMGSNFISNFYQLKSYWTAPS